MLWLRPFSCSEVRLCSACFDYSRQCFSSSLRLHSDLAELLLLCVVQEGDSLSLAELLQTLPELFDLLPQLRSLRSVQQFAFLVVLDGHANVHGDLGVVFL